MLVFLAAVCTGLAVGLAALGTVRLIQNRPGDLRIRKLVEEPEAVRRALSWNELRRRGPSTLPLLREWLLTSPWALKVGVELDQAGLRLRTGEYIIIRLALALVAFAVIVGLSRSGVGLVLAVAGAAAAWLAPAFYLRMLRQRRIDQIAKQLPEAVTMMANALRAGFAFQHGISMVSEQMEPPIAEEFTRMTIDMNVGASVEDALNGLLQRADSEELNLLVTAVLVQRSSGGNLAEILENLGEHMREKERLVGEVRTMTAQQRFSGTVMVFWPLLLLGVFSLLNWDQTSMLFTTSVGLMMLGAGVALQALGYFTIRRILDVEI
jgi:tight adherence protein B